MGVGARRSSSQSTVTAIALLLFVGAMGKSAQVPLHIWLPDAMEGPTPGLGAHPRRDDGHRRRVPRWCARTCSSTLSDHAGTVVAWVGAITALFAATVAIVQNDIKRVLAYSTISQLGYMFLAVGVGAYSAAIFHMVTHAFFKALLFLGAGSVIHGMRRRAGHAAHGRPAQVHADHRGHVHRRLARDRGRRSRSPASGRRTRSSPRRGSTTTTRCGPSALVAALLTAFYMTRQVWLVFYGDERWREPGRGDEARTTRSHEPHESPWIMTMPLVALAVLATVGGRHQPAVREQQARIPRPRGSSPCCTARPRSRRDVVRSRLRALDGRARDRGRRHRRRAARVYRNGLDADGTTRPSSGSVRSRRCSPTRTTSTSGWRGS